MDVAQLEEALFEAWPPLEIEHLGTWRLHFGEGHTSRRNSAQPVGEPPIPDAIAVVADRYRRRDLVPRFRITPLAPEGLDAELDETGWVRRAPTRVMVGPVTTPTASVDEAIEPRPSPAWLEARMRIGGVPADRVDPVARPYRDAGPVAGFARIGDPVVAVGMGVVKGPLVGVYSVMVDASARRRGLGQTLTERLITWGAELGATTAYLQVEEANSAALTLYRNLGFQEAYGYHYRDGPLERAHTAW